MLFCLFPITPRFRPAAAPPLSVTPSPGVPWFVDVTAASGIGFRHFDPATPQHYILETMGSGLGWIDYDNDGWLDLFCVQDGPVRPASADGPLPTNKLYRNNGDGTFTDVTEAVGLARAGFGMGCAVGDFDNDGFDDLVVTYWRGVVLYHNEPDGQGGRRFVDVTAKAAACTTPTGPPAAAGATSTATATSTCTCATTSRSISPITRSASTAPRKGSSSAARRDHFPRCRTGSIATAATGRSPTSAKRPASPPPRPRPGWAWSSPISTATGGSTSTWPTTCGRPTSSTTRAAGGSSRRACSAAAPWDRAARTSRAWASMRATWTAAAGRRCS